MTASRRRSRCREMLAITLACAFALGFSGPAFGFNALYPVLYRMRVFVEQCDSPATSCPEPSNEPCCEDQRALMVQLSSTTLFVQDGVLVVYGELMDRRGPRTSMVAASSVVCLALVLLYVNSLLANRDSDLNALWFVGFGLLGLSGPGIFLSTLSLGEKYSALEPVITPLLTAMFDASALVFLFWSRMTEGLSMPFSAIVLLWLCLGLLLSIACLPSLPTRPAMSELRDTRTVEAVRRSHGSLRSQGSLAGSSRARAHATACQTPFLANRLTNDESDAQSCHSWQSVPSSLHAEGSMNGSMNGTTTGATSSTNLPRAAVPAARALTTEGLAASGLANNDVVPLDWSPQTSLVHLLLRFDTVLLVGFLSLANLNQAFYINTMAHQLTLLFGKETSEAVHSSSAAPFA